MLLNENQTELINDLAKDASHRIKYSTNQEIENAAEEAIAQNFDGLITDEHEQLKELFIEYLQEYLHELL